jgi:hypothetical protein
MKEKQKSIVPFHKSKTVNYYMKKQYEQAPGFIEKFILKGWTPEKPFITKDNFITAFGSCFARSITSYLQDKGYKVGNNLKKSFPELREANIHVIDYAEVLNNTFVVRQQFEWAFENKEFDDELWYNDKGEFVGYDLKTKDATKKVFLDTDVFILTLGLSEIWYNKKTGDVFWRSMPEDKYNADIHAFRVSTMQENLDNIQAIYDIIRKHKPDAKIVLTLSPIPLYATFRPVSCITANTASKAILRAAVDEFYRNNSKDSDLYYWPSYEIVQHHGKKAFGEDNRHIEPEIRKSIMVLFEKYYCK